MNEKPEDSGWLGHGRIAWYKERLKILEDAYVKNLIELRETKFGLRALTKKIRDLLERV